MYQRVHKHTSVHYVFPPFTLIIRSNSGIKNRHNFFMSAIFLVRKIETGSVLILGYQNFCIIPWEFDYEILAKIWNCVGGAQILKCEISIFSSQEIVSSLVSFRVIMKVLQFEFEYRFKFYSMGSKSAKIPEFNLSIIWVLKF